MVEWFNTVFSIGSKRELVNVDSAKMTKRRKVAKTVR